jgi:alpha-1,2-mannosyltransferase
MSVPAAAPRARSVGGFRGETTTWAVAATLLVAGLACLASPNFHAGFDPARGPLGGDFLQEWIGGYLVRSGQAARLYDGPYVRALEHDAGLVGFDWSGQRYLPMVYPPFYYALVSPLSLLPLGAAGVVWAALMILFLAATQVLLARGLEGPGGRSAWLWPCAILFAPLVQNLTSGQKGTVLLLLFAATYVLFRRGRPFWAGVVFGLLAFKPQLTLVIGAAMLAKGRWRFVAGAAATVAALVLASLATGADACRDYLAFSARAADYLRTAGYELAESHSWYGFFHLLLGGASDAAIRVAAAVAVAATLAAVAWLLWGRLETCSGRFAVQYSGLMIATLLVSPHLFTYDLTVLVLPAMLVGLEHGRQAWSGDRWARRIVLGTVALLVVSAVSTPLARLVGIQASVVAMSATVVLLAAARGRLSPATLFS